MQVVMSDGKTDTKLFFDTDEVEKLFFRVDENGKPVKLNTEYHTKQAIRQASFKRFGLDWEENVNTVVDVRLCPEDVERIVFIKDTCLA